MENFVIVKKEKIKNEEPYFVRSQETELSDSIMAGNITHVWGPPGSGKTFMVKKVLENFNFFDWGEVCMKSKKEVIANMEKLMNTDTVLYFDNVQTDSVGWKYLVTFISEPPCIIGPVVIVSTTMYTQFDRNSVNFIQVEQPSVNQLMQFCENTLKIPRIRALCIWGKSKNMRKFMIDAICFKKYGLVTDKDDKYYTSTQNINDLLCEGGSGYRRFIGHSTDEYGHMMDVMFTNNNCDTLDNYATYADSISIADTLDSKIYDGNWDFLPYLTLQSCVIPSMVTKKVPESSITPGSAWTKMYNYFMRKKMIDDAHSRRVDTTMFSLMRTYLSQNKPDEFLEKFKNYDLRACDIDLMNHLCKSGPKLKVKSVKTVKAALKDNVVRRGQVKEHRGAVQF